MKLGSIGKSSEMKFITKFWLWLSLVLGAMAGGGLTTSLSAYAGNITTFTNGDSLSATSLNANFQHLHASVGHGHGAILVDADVSRLPGLRSQSWQLDLLPS